MVAEEQPNGRSRGTYIPQWCRILLVFDISLRLVAIGVFYYRFFMTPSRDWKIWWENYLHQTGNAEKGHLLLLLFV